MDPADMEKQKPFLTPEQDALNHIANGKDKAFLEQRFINSFKGLIFVFLSIFLLMLEQKTFFYSAT